MSEPFLGQIKLFAGNFVPRGWASCDGQLLSIASNPALFSLLGTTYGGDGETTFALPDLRGRAAIHPDPTAVRLGNRLGSRGGEETVVLSGDQIPEHTHDALARVSGGPPDTADPTGSLLGRAPFYREQPPNTEMSAGAVSVSSSGGQAHENMQPFRVINFIIATTGLFPSES